VSDRFAHAIRIAQIRDGDRLELVADEGERTAIARRLGLGSIERLEAQALLSRKNALVRATGRLTASLEQSCVVTGEPVAAQVDAPFDLVFTPAPESSAPVDEIELGQGDCDTVFYDGGKIDLGGAIADTLALSLDPYPRSTSADTSLKEAGVLSESEAGPFAALAELKKRLDNS
jgi:uncharacterized metal-binding protein YceD (DUF177 family)